MDFTDKVVIVTGASRGIGLATANYFWENGATVIFAVRKPHDFKLSPETKSSKRAFVIKLDVTQVKNIEEAVRKIAKKFGKIDILINNAGVDEPCSVVDITEKHLDYVMNTNFKGLVFCSKFVAREMVKKRYGKIINLSSIAGKEGTLYHLAYVSSKHAVIGATKCMARELIKYNINVNAVSPGLIDTDMLRGYFKAYSKLEKSNAEDEIDKLVHQTPRGKMGSPEDVAVLIGFLVSDEASNIVGHTFNTDGGILQH